LIGCFAPKHDPDQREAHKIVSVKLRANSVKLRVNIAGWGGCVAQKGQAWRALRDRMAFQCIGGGEETVLSIIAIPMLTPCTGCWRWILRGAARFAMAGFL
jgi:hypothetical protein